MGDDLLKEIERLRDALDHIQRVAKKARRPTLRLDWIASRAKLALMGRDFNMADLPQYPRSARGKERA